MPSAKSPAPVPLTPALHHILLALLQGERHGYAIMRDVERITDGTMRMGPGTLYGSIKRLLEAGLVEEAGERDDPQGDERRRYYRITASGRRAVVAETTRLQRLVAFAHGNLRQSEVAA
jgi:DNA-binding PadR family transcriptional regulator